jgi:hypothetical protein
MRALKRLSDIHRLGNSLFVTLCITRIIGMGNSLEEIIKHKDQGQELYKYLLFSNYSAYNKCYCAPIENKKEHM